MQYSDMEVAAEMRAAVERLYDDPTVYQKLAFSQRFTVTSTSKKPYYSWWVVLQENLSREGGATINANRALHVEGANRATNWTLGCVEYLIRIDEYRLRCTHMS